VAGGWIDPSTFGWIATDGGDYALKAGSPAYDAGDYDRYPDTWAKWSLYVGGVIDTEAKYNTYIAPYIVNDLIGLSRFNGPPDMGAYEYYD
jgi:hypothetical protein